MFKDKLKFFIGKNEDIDKNEVDNKKKVENMVFLVILLIICIVIINYIWNGNKDSNKVQSNDLGKQLASTQKYQNNIDYSNTQVNTNNSNLEGKLENILSNINGVGAVKVFVSYSESSETVAMYNENSKSSVTEETDTSGGVRKIEETDSQKEIVYQESNGSKVPIFQKTIEPKLEGAIITAKGAADINVKTSIIQAVEAVTGLATHKIQVFEMNQN